MKHIYLVANWKSNKTIQEAAEWLSAFSHQPCATLNKNISIILCAPFTVLPMLQEEIRRKNLPIVLGTQNISPYSCGAFTGEVSASMVKGLAEYILLGHSERRRLFGETDEMLLKKSDLAKQGQFKVIYCIERSEISVPFQTDLIAYEPTAAIGTGKAEDPTEAEDMCKKIKVKYPGVPILYGGSVTAENISEFIRRPSIDGVLVGSASLDPEKFSLLVDAAISSYA